MSTNQVWRINGQSYTKAQLDALREKGLTPRTAQVEFVEAKPKKKVKVASEVKVPEATEPAIIDPNGWTPQPEVAAEVSPAETGVSPTEPAKTPESVDFNAMNFLQLKAYAKEKGMAVELSTKKEEILTYLNNLK